MSHNSKTARRALNRRAHSTLRQARRGRQYKGGHSIPDQIMEAAENRLANSMSRPQVVQPKRAFKLGGWIERKVTPMLFVKIRRGS